MPYPNFHSCRIRNPNDFQKGEFSTIKRGGLSIIIGRLKGKSTTTTQAIRYPKASYTAAEARKHCKEKGGTFEAAGSTQESIDRNPFLPDFFEGDS